MVDKSAGRNANMIPGAPGGETGKGSQTQGFVSGLKDLQGRYSSLVDLYEKQRSIGQKVSELLKALQQEVDAIIQIPPDVLGAPYTAAYLVSDAVVVMFDLTRDMTSKPLRSFPAAKIVTIVQACTPELKHLISEKEKSESVNLKSLEKVARELEEAQAMFSQIKTEGPVEQPDEEPRKAVAQEDSHNSSDIDRVIVDAVSESLKVLGHDVNRGVMSLLEKRYGFSMKDIPYHPRGFMEILDELVGSSAQLIEKRIVTEIKKTYPVEGDSFYEVVRSLRGRGSGGSGGKRKEGGDDPRSDPSIEILPEEEGVDETARTETKPEMPDLAGAPAKENQGGHSYVDEIVSNAVDKGLDMLGQDGKQVVFKLLEDRYGLRQEEIPQHPRGFVELLEGMVGNGGRVIEKEIISEIKKEGPVEGKSLDEVVDSLREQSVAPDAEATSKPEVDSELVAHEEPTTQKNETGTPAPETNSDSSGTQTVVESTNPKAENEHAGQEEPTLDKYKFEFKLEAKPVPISEFLIV